MNKEELKCQKCDSNDWRGFFHCKTCGSYFIFAKCKNCDDLRLEKCPIDGEELDLMEPSEADKQPD